METTRNFLMEWSVTKFLWDYLLSHPFLIVMVVFIAVTIWGFIDSRKSKVEKRDIVASHEVELGKFGLVVNAILEARKIVPKGEDVPVYITEANGLKKQMFPQELKGILVKLQDENILELKTFPDWLLPEDRNNKSAVKAQQERIQAMLDPSKNHFTVRLLKDLSKPDKKGSQS